MSHGKVTTSTARGNKITETFGKDDSLYHGSKANETGKELGGSITNLAHSISSGSANQKKG